MDKSHADTIQAPTNLDTAGALEGWYHIVGILEARGRKVRPHLRFNLGLYACAYHRYKIAFEHLEQHATSRPEICTAALTLGNSAIALMRSISESLGIEDFSLPSLSEWETFQSGKIPKKII